ncbi:hypothetical protein [Roseovarius phycicola]|uniref:Uncharacterized protein n=1 Tax=Roseovarius phycicola TaxID=3080976 RepID=A0ABZ2HPY5_9RHOB
MRGVEAPMPANTSEKFHGPHRERMRWRSMTGNFDEPVKNLKMRVLDAETYEPRTERRKEKNMDIENYVPNFDELMDRRLYPNRRFCVRNICPGWNYFPSGVKSYIGRQFRQRVEDGVYPDIISIGTYYHRGSEEYVKLAR